MQTARNLSNVILRKPILCEFFLPVYYKTASVHPDHSPSTPVVHLYWRSIEESPVTWHTRLGPTTQGWCFLVTVSEVLFGFAVRDQFRPISVRRSDNPYLSQEQLAWNYKSLLQWLLFQADLEGGLCPWKRLPILQWLLFHLFHQQFRHNSW